MRKTALKLLTIALFALMSACVYRQDIPQGNLLDDEDIEQVEVGMTQSQVRFLLGSPMMDAPFHADRWLYHYYLDSQREHRNRNRFLSIQFDEQGRVSHIDFDPNGRRNGDSGRRNSDG
ncbi:outer membrane protein assembly factor BamE [Natronospira bacteriovora]|uniref:Outer membrane protein assembly factor BamE n=1 Tax=Natronospira bacteriovora TaxID=3069753 RepID=A0ABU0W520_9GAMM|nr:outer membrane protein assembly factor BamE [Natronospira sp. AB-CW4]MDQ2069110.1 outer membrane protein assembly factor BamE [Natronospira sp. AB-CW4]